MHPQVGDLASKVAKGLETMWDKLTRVLGSVMKMNSNILATRPLTIFGAGGSRAVRYGRAATRDGQRHHWPVARNERVRVMPLCLLHGPVSGIARARFSAYWAAASAGWRGGG